MYHKWLDRWDEERACRGAKYKTQENFKLGHNFAFPNSNDTCSLHDFILAAEKMAENKYYYDVPQDLEINIDEDGDVLTFQSPVVTDVEENNTVVAKITRSKKSDQAIIVFHHWNAVTRQRALAKYLSVLGITVVEISLPYHLERTRVGSMHADYMLGANLGRTLQSVRQAVIDGRVLVKWLLGKGFNHISVLGMSLGSWIAGLVAANDTAISKAALFLSGSSLADMVWTGRATGTLKTSLQQALNLDELRRAWAPVDLAHYCDQLSRSSLSVLVLVAQRDTVVLPDQARNFVEHLKNLGATPQVVELNCGHYSLGLPPYVLYAGDHLRRFLKEP